MAISTLEALSERTQRFRYAWSPRLLFSELLLKQWFEPIIPFTVMVALLVGFSLAIPNYTRAENIVSTS